MTSVIDQPGPDEISINREKIDSGNPVDAGTLATKEPSAEPFIKASNPDGTGAMAEPIGDDPLEVASSSLNERGSSHSLPIIDRGDDGPILSNGELNSVGVANETSSCPPTPQVEEGDEIPTNTAIVAEAETDSKEQSRSAVVAEQTEQEPTDASVATEQASGSSSNVVTVDVNAPSTISDEDHFIDTPHENGIVERSPGGRYVRFTEKLGSGASKDVYRAYDTQEGIEVAWNVVHLAGVPRNERNRIVNEVQLLERLHHHNIISFHGSWVNREKQQVNFVTEILSSGTLKSFITKVQVIRWKIAKRWAVQILKGLEYLHSQDPPVIHRDLKCENIFINGTSGDLRIGDLGLSTVHRNGKQLSVLGTPEFMAPDMYEENPYDEKVDVYSFGMCMLEIFTKEIPYRECSNPAQIYKRVSRGDPPECLRRIHSKNAREFIELCLGHMDENEKYIRPSATELLAHPFLQKRPNDDDEVEVSPPMQERTIGETSISSSPSLQQTVPKDRPSPTSSSSQQAESLTGASSSSKQRQHSRTNSLEDDGSDRFGEMPDSEVNMRKVKVMMGRGRELDEEDDQAESVDANASLGSANGKAGENSSLGGPMDPNVATDMNSQLDPDPPVNMSPSQPSMHYLVAAAVIESNSNTLPYQDDILKLVVTLPVDGQTQNVQFDFHLVEDDPIQVAKEMVAELGIPEGAVLEISETISGLARAARVNQDKYFARQQTQGHARSTSQLPSVASLPAMPANPEMQQGMVQQMQPMNQVQNQGMVSSASHHSMPDFRNEQQQMVQSHSHQAQGMLTQERQVPMGHQQQVGQPSLLHQSQMQPQHILVQNNENQNQHSEMASQASYGQQSMQMTTNLPQHYMNSSSNLQSESSGQQHQQFAPSPAEPANHALQQQYSQSASMHGTVNMQQAPSPPAQAEVSPAVSYGHSQPQHMQVPPQQNTALNSQSQGHATFAAGQMSAGQMHPQASNASQTMQMQERRQQGDGGHVTQQQQHPSAQVHQANAQPQPPQPPIHQSSHFVPQHGQNQGYGNGAAPPAHAQSIQSEPSQVHAQTPMLQQQIPMQQAQQFSQVQQFSQAQQLVPGVSHSSLGESSNGGHQSLQPEIPLLVPGQQEVAFQETSNPQQAAADEHIGMLQDSLVDGVLGAPTMTTVSHQLDEELAVELRKLDEEYQKTVSRAKKVFDSRMDNMTRLQHEREAQHQKTLTDHERRRADFEKRLQQEEIEQNRRIVQLQEDWERKRDEVRRIQELEALAENSPESLPTDNENAMPVSDLTGSEDFLPEG